MADRVLPVRRHREPWPHRGLLLRVLHMLFRPTTAFSVLTLAGGGLIVGAVAMFGFGQSLTLTGGDAFCTSCHARDAAVEWRQSVHYVNEHGLRAGCADCHLPHSFIPEMLRKAQAAGEVWAWLTGRIDTPAKYEANRARLAAIEWARLRANNSAECRDCHHRETMDNPAQPMLRDMHRAALTSGQTCIDCHTGVAHKPPS